MLCVTTAEVKICESCLASIPLPVSRTLTSTAGPRRPRQPHYFDRRRSRDFSNSLSVSRFRGSGRRAMAKGERPTSPSGARRRYRGLRCVLPRRRLARRTPA
jgi:hypothetical protein